PTNEPHDKFLTFFHHLVSTSFRWTPHAKAHSITKGAGKFALTLRKREAVMQRFRSAGALQRFIAVFSAVRNLFIQAGSSRSAADTRRHRRAAFRIWRAAVGLA
ncbi:hypothetical protein CEJ86_30660, partial [Sinorhizobium meliloti]